MRDLIGASLLERGPVGHARHVGIGRGSNTGGAFGSDPSAVLQFLQGADKVTEVGKEEVTALCKRYLDFLDKMLNDFCTDNQRASILLWL